MDLQKNTRQLAIILLIFMVMGQLSELKYQRVSYGADIKQYAVVQKVSVQGANYYIPCEDCTCTITVTDELNNVLVNGETCTNEENGLYTYPLTGSGYNIKQLYSLKHYCISPTYGNGTVISSMEVAETTTPSLTAFADGDTVTDVTVWKTCKYDTESWIPGLSFYACEVGNTLGRIQDSIAGLAASLTGSTSTGIIEGFFKGFEYATNNPLIWGLEWIILVITDPVTALKSMWASALGILGGIVVALGLPLLFFEMYAVYECVSQPTGPGMIKKLLEVNVRLFNWIFNLIMQVLGFFSNLVPGT